MNDEKQKALLTLFDGDEEAVKALISRADSTEKQANNMGIAFKDKKLAFNSTDELLAYAIAQKEAEVATQKAKEEAEASKEEEEFDFKGYMTEMKNMMEGYMKKMAGERDTKKEDTTSAIKEATDAHSQRIAALEATLKQNQEALTTAVKELGELKGNAPAGIVNGHRPTQSTDNIVAKKEQKGGFEESLKGWAEFAVGAPQ